MNKKMLIDATHPEETRVVVVENNCILDFDTETVTKKQLVGNIYLAKVTRVEPSLQAAFVEYGTGKQGFLAFSEIHPDYYQIPTEDRKRILEEERRHHRQQEGQKEDDIANGQEEDDSQRKFRPKAYKIHEVIKKRQILLVQVMKEERGNKGAALTTYLSMPGRYCVLMPNTARGSGISRKITNIKDRQKLKKMMSDMEIPDTMGLIVRTAGSNRTKHELKRDYEYLIRLWDNVRELTLKSIAPCLVYEEGSLIKRAIRDIYSKDIEQVFVEGDVAYREAKDFMKMLMPSHSKFVQPYREKLPLFTAEGVEKLLDGLHSPTVPLKSGGYLVINQTEALVAIDINSGKSTKEHSIEETALATNVEACEEIARQLRLRDLAGLIVIDFIDMENHRNIRAVEKELKDVLKNDRARIQVGRISNFGLMEMTRQRLRPAISEMNTQPCLHCEGTGVVRSVQSASLQVLRLAAEQLQDQRIESITIQLPIEMMNYLFNHKRHHLVDLEQIMGKNLILQAVTTLHSPHFIIDPVYCADFEGEDAVEPRPVVRTIERVVERVVQERPVAVIRQIAEDIDEEDDSESDAEQQDIQGDSAEGRRRKRKRKRRRGSEEGVEENNVSSDVKVDAESQESDSQAVPERHNRFANRDSSRDSGRDSGREGNGGGSFLRKRNRRDRFDRPDQNERQANGLANGQANGQDAQQQNRPQNDRFRKPYNPDDRLPRQPELVTMSNGTEVLIENRISVQKQYFLEPVNDDQVTDTIAENVDSVITENAVPTDIISQEKSAYDTRRRHNRFDAKKAEETPVNVDKQEQDMTVTQPVIELQSVSEVVTESIPDVAQDVKNVTLSAPTEEPPLDDARRGLVQSLVQKLAPSLLDLASLNVDEKQDVTVLETPQELPQPPKPARSGWWKNRFKM